jgi:hypothetical protein
MPSKYEVISALFKDELLEVASDYNIPVGKSWPKMELVKTIGDKLSAAQIKKLVNKYTSVEEDVEESDESLIEENKGTRPAMEFSDILAAMKSQKFTRDELIDEMLKKGIKLTQAGLAVEKILELYPKFADYLRSMLLGTATGKGLEFRTYRWLSTDKNIKAVIKDEGGELTMEHSVQGKSRPINFDIYFRMHDRRFLKKGYLEGFVECKHVKSGISDNLISIFQGQVEDVCARTGKAPYFAKFVTSSYYIQSATDFAKHHPVRTYEGDVYIELWQEKEPGIFKKIQ